MRIGAALSAIAASIGCGNGGSDAGTAGEPIAVSGSIAVLEAYAPAPILPETAALYFTLRNTAGTPDTVLSVIVDVADSASLHTQARAGGSMRMMPLEYVEVPANGSTAFVPGGKHVMLTSPRRRYVEGDTIRAQVRLARAGVVSFPAVVLSYAEVAERFVPAPPADDARHD